MKIDFINTPSPIGNFVNVRVTNNYAYISGQGAFDDSGNLITGKVGRDLNIDQAYDAARDELKALGYVVKDKADSCEVYKK